MGQNQHCSKQNDFNDQDGNYLEDQLDEPCGAEIYGMASKERTLPNVLIRIKYILDKKGKNPQPYKDAEFKQFWLPDNESKSCYDCSEKFNPFRRRHHCRICGQIFCKSCCNKMVPGKIMGYTGELRACMFCCKVTVSFLKSTNLEEDILADLNAVQEQLLPNEPEYDHFDATIGGQVNNETDIDGNLESIIKRKGMYGFMEENYAVQSRTIKDQDVPHISSERQLLLKDSEQLRSLWTQMIGKSSYLPMSTNRWKLKVFQNSFIGRDFVQWLIDNDKASSRQSAVAIGQALLEAGYIFCMCQENQIFIDDYLIYNAIKPGDIKSSRFAAALSSQEGGHEPLWFKQIKSQNEGGKYEEKTATSDYNMSSSSYSLNMNLEDNTVTLKSSKKKRGSESSITGDQNQSSVTAFLNSSILSEHASCSAVMSEEVLQAIKTLESMEAEKRAAGWQHPNRQTKNKQSELPMDEQTKLSLTVQERFNTLWSTHEKKLLHQLLESSGLSSSWADTIMPIVYKVVETVRPDVKNEYVQMDIRQYIQFKKVPGGKRKDCQIVNGTVCTKNVVHRSMKSNFKDPQLLLISSDIDHTAKVGSQILSVSSVLTQETDYLKRVIPKIISFRPDIILCERRITYNAREQLKAAGITLVMNIKKSVMERVARCTQASIIKSVETDLTSVPINLNSVSRPLGMCHSFYLHNYNLPSSGSKTLMFFDGCATHLGCTIILRGAPNSELKRVKQILYFMILAFHNWKLERSFLMDVFSFYPSYSSDSFHIENNRKREGSKKDYAPVDSNKDHENIEFRKKLGEMDEQLGSKNINLDKVVESNNFISENPCEESKQVTSIEKLNDVLQSESILKVDGTLITLEDAHSSLVGIDFGTVKRQIFPNDLISESNSNYFEDNPGYRSNLITCDNTYDAGSKLVYPSHSTPDKVSQTVTVMDCSDPLQSYLKKDPLSIGNLVENKKECQSLLKNKNFKTTIDKTILSISPYIKYNLPYLETESGRNSPLRKYFPEKIYFSTLLEEKKSRNITKNVNKEAIVKKENKQIETKPLHYFITSKLTKSAKSFSIRSDLADFRARGCSIRKVCPCEKQDDNPEAESEHTVSLLDEKLMNEKSQKSYYTSIETSDGSTDALHPYNHQRISVLFSNFSHLYHLSSSFCVDPRVVTMYFYGINDIPLGAYLERYCFDLNYKCPCGDCSSPCLRHVRKFVHENGCVEILLRTTEISLNNINSSTIYIWSWCKICRQVSPVVPMSSDTWRFSFAKYLELRFHENTINRRGNPGCSHSIHKDHFHYFGQRNVVAVFRYSLIDIRELIIPHTEIPYTLSPAFQSFIVDQIKSLAIQGYGLFTTILDRLQNISEEMGQRWEPNLSLVATHHHKQRQVFREGIESIQMQLTSPSLERRTLDSSSPTSCQEMATIMYGILDQVVIMKRLIIKVVNDWNMKVQTLYQAKKKEERTEKPKINFAAVDQSPNISNGRQSSVPMLSTITNVYDDDKSTLQSSPLLPHLSNQTTTESGNVESTFKADSSLSIEEKRRKMVRSSSNPEPTLDMPFSIQNKEDSDTNKGLSKEKITQNSDICFNAANRSSLGSGSSPYFANSMTEKDISGGIVEAFLNSSSEDDAAKSIFSPDPEGVCVPFQPFGLQSYISPVKNYHQHHERSLSDDVEICLAKEAVEKVSEKRYSSSVKNIISTLLSSSADLLIKNPFDPNQHYGVLNEVKIPLVLYDDEPSSIIAVALASQEYDTQLQALQMKLNESQQNNENHPVRSFEGSSAATSNIAEVNITSDASSSPVNVPIPAPKVEDIPQKNRHIELQWSDPNVNANYYCKIYFAERFRRLRSLVFPYGEEFFIRSLSRCVIWEARGGKSGSFFCKTTDDRFVLKEMSKLEVNSFFTFAPFYFQFMNECFTNNQPTTLTRIVGVFRIGFKNATTNKQQKCDLLVMENLFYRRAIGPKYDLKGSVRNRKVDVTGKMESELVLLDENLLQTACSSQFFLRPHNRTILIKAINSDSAFLSQHLIMDYSLLVGLDENKNEIVVGIIDYIRTFTWDKKLETIIKGSVLSAGTGKQPTVISPELYRERFCLAMEKYFALSPDRWSGFGQSIDS